MLTQFRWYSANRLDKALIGLSGLTAGGKTSQSDTGEHIESDLLSLQIDRKPLKWLVKWYRVMSSVFFAVLQPPKKGGQEKNFHGLE